MKEITTFQIFGFLILLSCTLPTSKHFVFQFESTRILITSLLISFYAVFKFSNSPLRIKAGFGNLLTVLVFIIIFLLRVPQQNLLFLIGVGSNLISFYIILKNNDGQGFTWLRVFFFVGLIQSLLCLGQFLGVQGQISTFFTVLGSFENPNLTALLIMSCIPFSVAFYNHSRNNLIIPALILMVFVLILLKSRAIGLVALVYMILYLIRKSRLSTIYIMLILLVSLSLFLLEIDSSKGRLHIWNISSQLAQIDFLKGLGHYGFSTYYMPAQAEFFNAFNDSFFRNYADQVNNPFNEYLSILINYGIIGLGVLVYVILKSFRRLDFIFDPFKITAFSILVFAAVSYPFQYYYVIIILIICFSNFDDSKGHLKDFSINKYCYFVIISVVTLSSLFIYRYSFAEYNWAKQTVADTFNQEEYLQLKKKLNGISQFNHDLAFKFYEHKMYEESLAEIKNYETKKISYDVTILKSLNYIGQNEYGIGLNYLKIASNMIPVRYLPKYEIFKIYSDILVDEDKSIQAAKDILNTRIKIASPYVHSVRFEAMKYLKEKKIEIDFNNSVYSYE